MPLCHKCGEDYPKLSVLGNRIVKNKGGLSEPILLCTLCNEKWYNQYAQTCANLDIEILSTKIWIVTILAWLGKTQKEKVVFT